MLWLDIIFGMVAIASLVYAVMTNREKRKLERLVRSTMAKIAGSIDRIRYRSRVARKHCRELVKESGNLPPGEHAKMILDLSDAASDSLAAYDGLGHTLNYVYALQEGLFETRLTEHPDIKEEQEGGDQ